MHAINSGCLARGFMRPMIFLPRDLLASDVHGQEKRAFWVSASNVLDKTIPFDDDLDAPNENNIRFRCSLLRAVLMSHSLKVVRGLILRDRFLWWPPAKRHPNSQDKLGGPLDWTHIAKYAPRQSFKKTAWGAPTLFLQVSRDSWFVHLKYELHFQRGTVVFVPLAVNDIDIDFAVSSVSPSLQKASVSSEKERNKITWKIIQTTDSSGVTSLDIFPASTSIRSALSNSFRLESKGYTVHPAYKDHARTMIFSLIWPIIWWSH